MTVSCTDSHICGVVTHHLPDPQHSVQPFSTVLTVWRVQHLSMFATPSHLPKLLPWVDWPEWQLCSDQLFTQWSIAQPPYSTTDATTSPLPLVRFSAPPSFPPSLRLRHRSALERISLWRLRGRLPLSIESTADLVEALHIDAAFASASSSSSSPTSSSSPPSVTSERSVRHHYALALLRFVNSVVDAQQSRGVAVSVAHLASAVQLPRLLVDVRHEATHGALPALSVLRYSAMEAVRWLYRRYWKVQEESSSGAQRRLSQRLRAYQQRAEEDLSASASLSAAALGLLSEALDQSLSSSQLSALLLPTLFSTATSISSSFCLQPPVPLYLHPCTPTNIARHFEHLQAVWQPLLSIAVRRIRRFRVEAVKVMAAALTALQEQRTMTVADGLREEDAERAETEDQGGSVLWQVQLMRLWCRHLLASLNDEERRPFSLLPLVELSIGSASPLLVELHSQLLPLLAPHLPSTALPGELSRWLAASQQLTTAPTASSSSSSSSSSSPSPSSPSPTVASLSPLLSSTSSWSLAELRSAVQRAQKTFDGEAETSEEEVQQVGRSDSVKRGKGLMGEGDRPEFAEFSSAAAVSRCTEWTACPLGALPHQTQPNRSLPAQAQSDMQLVDEEESAALRVSPPPSPRPARCASAPAVPPHLVEHLRALQAAVLAL